MPEELRIDPVPRSVRFIMRYGLWVILAFPIALFLIGWLCSGNLTGSLFLGGMFALLFLGVWLIERIDLDLLFSGRERYYRVQHYRKAIHLLDGFQQNPRFSDHLTNHEMASFKKASGDLRWMLWAELYGLPARAEQLEIDLQDRNRNKNEFGRPET